jgi:hypothetical protein
MGKGNGKDLNKRRMSSGHPVLKPSGLQVLSLSGTARMQKEKEKFAVGTRA